MTQDEAARVLEIWKRYISKVDDIEEEEVNAIFAAIDALRENPCDNCVGVGLAVAHGFTDMRTRKLEEER